MDYVLSCCSTADLEAEDFEERDIQYICFHFNVDGKDYPDDLGVSYPFKQFYDDMAKGALTKTSQVSVGEYVAYFEPFLEQGKDIFITPGNIFMEEAAGSNELLREMPHAMVFSASDVLDAMRVNREVREKEAVELDFAESQIVDALHDNELHFEELLDITGLSVSELTNTLINLELNGVIEQLGGNYYTLA